jgi:hypothetical protein
MREPARDVLGVDQLAVEPDIEDTAATLDELGLDAEALLDLRRQTGGAGAEVSGDAVFDRDRRHLGGSIARRGRWSSGLPFPVV